MGISKPSQGCVKHQKDMAVLSLLSFVSYSALTQLIMGVFVVFSQAWAKHQKDMAVLSFQSLCLPAAQ